MTQFVNDTLSRSSYEDISANPGETGATWVKNASSGSFYITDPSGAAGMVGAISGAASTWYSASGTPGSANYDVTALFVVGGGLATLASVTSRQFIIGRYAVTGGNWATGDGYAAGYDWAAGQWRLWRVDNSVLSSPLGSWTESLSTSDTRTVKLEMRGSTIKVFVAGVERISATDGTYSAAGLVGLGNTSDGIQGGFYDGLRLSRVYSDDAPTGSITLDVTPENAPTVVQRTGSTTFTATISRAGGFTGTVNVAVTGLPSGVTASPAPLAITNPNTSGTITLSATGAATLGAATVTFTASGSGVSDVTDPVDISVTAAPPTPDVPVGRRRRAMAAMIARVGG